MKLVFFEVGQQVWCPTYGWGTVTSVTHNSCRSYPIKVQFNNGHSDTFTSEGKRLDSDINVSLFQDAFELPINKPIPQKFNVGDWIVITKSDQNWCEEMDSMNNRVVKITTVCYGDRIMFKGSGRFFWKFGEGHFRLANPEEIPCC